MIKRLEKASSFFFYIFKLTLRNYLPVLCCMFFLNNIFCTIETNKILLTTQQERFSKASNNSLATHAVAVCS